MKLCGYCGRENNDGAMRCQECGTSFAACPAPVSGDSQELRPVPPFAGSVAGGGAVVLICTGVVWVSREAFPWIYGFGLFLDLWMVLLAVVACCLAQYAGTLCCRGRWRRVGFTLTVMAVLAAEWLLYLRVAEPERSTRGSAVAGYAGSALLIITGILTLAWIRRRESQHPPKGVSGAAPGNASTALIGIPGKGMEPSSFDQFPWWMVVVCNGVGLAIYAIGLYLMARIGIVWGLLYAAYCVWMEWRLLSGSCRSCYYFGKRCGFGKGRVCSWFFAQGPERSSGSKRISWRDVVPDFLVSLIPLGVGAAMLIRGFSWPVLLLMVVLAFLASVGTGFVRGQLACKHCKQRELGCPAEQLFSKTKHT